MNISTHTTAKASWNPMQDEIKALFAKMGLTVKIGRASYSTPMQSLSFKLEVSNGAVDTNAVTFDANNAYNWDFKVSPIGKSFIFKGKTYRVSGFAPRSYKRPILATRVKDGKVFKFSVASIKASI